MAGHNEEHVAMSELTLRTQQNSSNNISNPNSNNHHTNHTNNVHPSNAYLGDTHNARIPIHHPNYHQISYQHGEKMDHLGDFQRFIGSYWQSLQSSCHGLMNTPKDVYEEVKYFANNPSVPFREILNGIAMAIVVLPESISFAGMVEMSPLTALLSAFWVMATCAVLGARPPMISSSAASTYAIYAAMAGNSGAFGDLTTDQRRENIALAVLLSGVLQILLGWFHISKFLKLLPASVIVAFCNGLAIAIIKGQFHLFETCRPPDGMSFKHDECPHEYIRWFKVDEGELWRTLLIFFLCLCIMFLWERLTFMNIGKVIPASLVAMIIGSIVEHLIFRRGLEWRTRTLADTSPLHAGWPNWSPPRYHDSTKSNTIGTVILYAIYGGVVGCLESMLTVLVMNQKLNIKTQDSDLNQESFSQGVGCVLGSLFGGTLAGCATVGESILLITNGSRHRLTTMTSAFFLLVIINWVKPAVNLIPMSTFGAIVVCITLYTFYWPTFVLLFTARKTDVLIIVVGTILAVVTNLCISTAVGVGIAALSLIVDQFNNFHITEVDDSILVKRQQQQQQSTNPNNTNNNQHGNNNTTHDNDTSGNQDTNTGEQQEVQQEDEESILKQSIYNLPNWRVIDQFFCTQYSPSTQSHNMNTMRDNDNGGNDNNNNNTNSTQQQTTTTTTAYQNRLVNSPLPSAVPMDMNNNNNNIGVYDNNNNNTNVNGYDQLINSTPSQLPQIITPSITTTRTLQETNCTIDPALLDSEYLIIPAKLFTLRGMIFFGTARQLLLDVLPHECPPFVVLDCAESIFNDYSAADALCQILGTFSQMNKRVKLINVNKSVQSHRTLLHNRTLRDLLCRIEKDTYIVYTQKEADRRGMLRKQIEARKKEQQRQQQQQQNIPQEQPRRALSPNAPEHELI